MFDVDVEASHSQVGILTCKTSLPADLCYKPDASYSSGGLRDWMKAASLEST